MFAMLIREAFFNADDAGIYLKYRTDGEVFNLRRFQAKSKVSHSQILTRELLFADDYAIIAYTFEHTQKLMDCFAVMLQPRPGSTLSKANLCVEGTELNISISINHLFVQNHRYSTVRQ